MSKAKRDWKRLYIVRIDHKSTHCWNVRLIRKQVVVQKAFSDGVYGGKMRAYRAAQQWRDIQIERYGGPQRYFTDHKRSVFNVVGVSIAKKIKNKNTFYGWGARAQVSVGGRPVQRHKEFSILEYGYAQAYWNAVKWRHAMIGIVVPRTVTLPEPPTPVRKWLEHRSLKYK